MRRLILFLFLAFFCNISSADDAKVSYVSIGTGVANVFKQQKCGEFRLEYKSWRNFRHIKPFGGITATTRSAYYIYGGFAIDLLFYQKFFFAPNFAAGYYHNGNGKNLGYPLEFRSSIELGWQFKNCWRLGAGFYHISNASLGRRNPGTESAVLFFSIPLKY